MTAHAFKRDKQNAMDAGVDIFLTKPIEKKVLMSSLAETINEKEDSPRNKIITSLFLET